MAILTQTDEFVRALNNSWQDQLKAAIRTSAELADRLDLPLNAMIADEQNRQFPLFVPEPFLSRIKKGDLQDPLLKQVLPAADELENADGFVADPLGEMAFHESSGLLKKYHGRALLVVNGTCAVHCRYCFRREFPYSDTVDRARNWSSAIEQICADGSIGEVILSGGDPLTVVDPVLEELVGRIAEIGHVHRLRVHTRLPIVIPSRVTQRLLKLFRSTRLNVVFVVHCNHAQEIDDVVVDACCRLNEVCSAVLNQAVLLREVNDDVSVLAALSERLFSAGVLPYYLHQLDRVAGAAHFEVSQQRGLELMKQLRAQLPGYLVPRYAQEIPGEANKTILA